MDSPGQPSCLNRIQLCRFFLLIINEPPFSGQSFRRMEGRKTDGGPYDLLAARVNGFSEIGGIKI